MNFHYKFLSVSFSGCARAIFQQSEGSKVRYREHFVCNYGPSGNLHDQSVYKVGNPCTSCQEGTVCSLEYEALCESKKRG